MNHAAARRPVIGSLGELLVEFVCTGLDGHHIKAVNYQGPFPSGAPGIFIDQAARVGATAIFAGAVGDDAFGVVLRTRLEAAGVLPQLIRTVPGVPTGSAFVSYNSDGSRDFVFNIAHSAAARFPRGRETADALLAAGVTVFHISGSTLGDPAMRVAAVDICRMLHDAGVAISFDPNLRKELLGDPLYFAAVQDLLAMSHYFLPSDDDAAVLFAGEDFAAFAPRLVAAGRHVVILKRGAKGCMGMATGGSTVVLPGHEVRVLDPTGAGDCFCATFVAVFAATGDFAAALERANAAGALAVGQVGPMEGNANLGAIEHFLAGRP